MTGRKNARGLSGTKGDRDKMTFSSKDVKSNVSVDLDIAGHTGKVEEDDWVYGAASQHPKKGSKGRGRYTFLQGRVLQGEKEGYENGYVYFIQGRITQQIKIGSTGDIKFRLSQLQTGSAEKLSYIGTILFSKMLKAREVEKVLHLVFGRYRTDGEWFSPNPELLSFIKKYIKDNEEFNRELRARLRETQEDDIEKSLDNLYPDQESKWVGRKELLKNLWVPEYL